MTELVWQVVSPYLSPGAGCFEQCWIGGVFTVWCEGAVSELIVITVVSHRESSMYVALSKLDHSAHAYRPEAY